IYLSAAIPDVVAAELKITLLAPVVILPAVKVNSPLIVGDVVMLNPVALLRVTLLENVVAEVPSIVCAAPPLKVTRAVPWVNVPLFEKLPPIFKNGFHV